ncbi:hypothetical protein CRENBAI_024549 [Crenichthys baileyi]|uniref:Tripartite motif-containing protein 16-like n=1 Tax=Crenichthys baileyi TaxID=28760 RepID=A0AAV9R8U2_9TELE
MASKRLRLDREAISCSICLDLLKDPVTIPCGHSYCMKCIKVFWDGEDRKGFYSCPQCRRLFIPRPDLVKNIMLANLVEDLKKTGLQVAPADHCYARPEDVACDVCTGRKMKAAKSCLVCLASYCENHLQPHYDAAPLRKHKLVDPSKDLQRNVSSNQKVMTVLLVDQESPEAERTEKQKELQVSRQQIQQRIQDQEKDLKLLQQEVEVINVSADRAVEDSEKIFTELIRLIQKRSSDVKQQIRSQQETEVSRVKDLQEKLEQEITELNRKDAELEQLSNTEDHNQFLLNYPSLSALSESTHSSSINIRPLRYFEDVTAAVSELRDKLQDILREDCRNISVLVSDVDVLVSRPEPETRADFLMYAREMTFDPNSANMELVLSESNRKVKFLKEKRPYVHHPERFTFYCEVLSKESLIGRSYWEVEKRGGGVEVGVAYKSIRRAGRFVEILLGFNEKSWSLNLTRNMYAVWHNGDDIPVPEPTSNRIGVYVDHRAGILAFYSISDTMTLLHRVQTTFSEPLHPAFRFFDSKGDSVEFLSLK